MSCGRKRKRESAQENERVEQKSTMTKLKMRKQQPRQRNKKKKNFEDTLKHVNPATQLLHTHLSESNALNIFYFNHRKSSITIRNHQ